jgi:hypothetical protein
MLHDGACGFSSTNEIQVAALRLLSIVEDTSHRHRKNEIRRRL